MSVCACACDGIRHDIFLAVMAGVPQELVGNELTKLKK